MSLDHVRSEIAFMRQQVGRQRKEILLLQKAGIPTMAADALLRRMLDKIDTLCAERGRLKAFICDENARRAPALHRERGYADHPLSLSEQSYTRATTRLRVGFRGDPAKAELS
jgi:hypothetical protein